MTFPTDQIELGAPNYGPRKGTRGIVFHTTEGTDASEAAALATVKWQGTAGNTSGGSYHFVLYDKPLGAILSVPYRDIAGSVSPAASRRWPRDKYPFIPDLVGEAAFADPNAYLLAISLSGKTSVFRDNGYPPNMVDTAARLVIWAESQEGWPADMPLTAHYQWNTSRTDPGTGFIDLVLARYAEIKNPSSPEKPVAIAPPNVVVKPEKWNGGEVTTIAESTDGVFRLRADGTWVVRAGMAPLVQGGDPKFIAAFNAVLAAGGPDPRIAKAKAQAEALVSTLS